MNESVAKALEALTRGELYKFMPAGQRRILITQLRKSDEALGIAETVLRAEQRIADMPVTYQQDGLEDQAVIHLHYFMGSVDAWITEKDMDGGVDQAFGLVNLMGTGPGDAELGYVSIRELVENGVELDLYWTPVTIAELKSK